MSQPHAILTKRYRLAAAAIATITGTAVMAGGGTVGASPMYSAPAADMTAQSQDMQPSKMQASADLRVGLNNLLREHVSASLDVTRAITQHASHEQIEGAMYAQDANSKDLAAAVGSVYGEEAQQQFLELFDEHIQVSNAYATAVADGNDYDKEQANAELQEYLQEIATFFSSAIPGLATEDVYGLLAEHEQLINSSTEAYAAGDYEQSFEIERQALTQVSGAADALASGIIATQPAKFE